MVCYRLSSQWRFDFFWSLFSCHDQASLFITRSHLVDCFRLFSTWLVDFSQLIHASFSFGRSIVDSTGCHLCGDIVQFIRSRPFLRYLNISKILLHVTCVWFFYTFDNFNSLKKKSELLCFLQHTPTSDSGMNDFKLPFQTDIWFDNFKNESA